jgi:alpha-1,4-digalacturonate transport system substrate-binding protein
MKIRRFFVLALVLMMAVTAFGPVAAQDEEVELRILWYNDGNEGEVLRDILDDFEAEHENISVVLDTVAYGDIHNILQASVEGGDVPDIARITLFQLFTGDYLDLRPYLSEEAQAYWEASFPAATLEVLQSGADDTGIYGFPNQFTVTGPFINATLFEQAGVDVPGAEATWQEWVDAAVEVAEVTGVPYAVAIDRSGHRFWGPSLTMGATYINEDGTITVDSEGFRETAEMIVGWHEDEITPIEVWVGSGDQYASARDEFVNGQLVLYMSGSWQVAGFANDIGDSFDWRVVPNPSGPGGSTGIPGGSGMVAMAGTEHPEEVAMLMEYLTEEDVMRDFSARTLFLPGHIGLGEIPFESNAEALSVFAAEVPKLSEEAFGLQFHPVGPVLNTSIRDRLTQVIVGELTLDEAIERIQEAVDEAQAQLEE